MGGVHVGQRGRPFRGRAAATRGHSARRGVAAVGRRHRRRAARRGHRARPRPGRAQCAGVWSSRSPSADRRRFRRRVLFPCADMAPDTIDRGLAQSGWEVQRVTAYRTVPTAAPEPALLARGRTGRRPRADRHLVGAGVRRPAHTGRGGRAGARARRLHRTDDRGGGPGCRHDGCPRSLGRVDRGHRGRAARTTSGRPGRRGPRSRVLRPPRSIVQMAEADATEHTTGFPARRLRRLRRTPALRRLVAEARLGVDDLVAPLFVREGIDAPVPIPSMPGEVAAHGPLARRRGEARWSALGLPGLILFGVPAAQGRGRERRLGPRGHRAGRAARGARRGGRGAGRDGRPVPRRVHRPRALRRARARRRGPQRPHARAVPAHRAGAGRGRGGRRGAERDDGRAGGRHPRRARRRRARGGGNPGLRRQVRARRSTARSATPST